MHSSGFSDVSIMATDTTEDIAQTSNRLYSASLCTFCRYYTNSGPVASAYSATATGGLSEGHGVIFALVGVAILRGFVLLKRIDRMSLG